MSYDNKIESESNYNISTHLFFMIEYQGQIWKTSNIFYTITFVFVDMTCEFFSKSRFSWYSLVLTDSLKERRGQTNVFVNIFHPTVIHTHQFDVFSYKSKNSAHKMLHLFFFRIQMRNKDVRFSIAKCNP